MNNLPHKFWWIYWKFEKFLFAKVFLPKAEILPALPSSWWQWIWVFGSLCLLRTWEYGELPTNFSDTHSCSCEKIICGALRAFSKSIFFFIYCLKEHLIHARLVFFIRQKVREISRDFWFWWFFNYLCCRISLCLLCSSDGIFKVAVCDQVNS